MGLIRNKQKSAIMLALGVLAMMLNTSCFGDEPANCEADIETAALHVANPDDFFFQTTDSLQVVLSTDSVITFRVRSHADVTKLAPEFTLSQGATVIPASGSVQDFSQSPVIYVVTSQDGKWQRRYTVSVVPTTTTVTDSVRYDFERYEMDPTTNKYYIWHNELVNGNYGNDWATSNSGFRISMTSAAAMDYPVTPLTQGYDGAGVCLTTRDTGPFGRMANKRLAAGSMFLGTFDVQVAMSDHLHATHFGIATSNQPVRFMGYYTYTPGEYVQDFHGKIIENRTDSAAVYAVLYRNHDENGEKVTLFGDDVLSSPYIVAIAEMEYVAPTNEWTAWDIPFEYKQPIDKKTLMELGYNITVVFSSSASAGDFIGAIGSRLCVDKVRIVCTHDE